MAGLADTEDARFKALIEEIMKRGVRPEDLQREDVRAELLRRYWAQYGQGLPTAERKASVGGMITGK